jgi:hypothetical protein
MCAVSPDRDMNAAPSTCRATPRVLFQRSRRERPRTTFRIGNTNSRIRFRSAATSSSTRGAPKADAPCRARRRAPALTRAKDRRPARARAGSRPIDRLPIRGRPELLQRSRLRVWHASAKGSACGCYGVRTGRGHSRATSETSCDVCKTSTARSTLASRARECTTTWRRIRRSRATRRPGVETPRTIRFWPRGEAAPQPPLPGVMAATCCGRGRDSCPLPCLCCRRSSFRRGASGMRRRQPTVDRRGAGAREARSG